MYYMLCLFQSLLAVNVLVVVHELGHMIAGRIFGVHSDRFCIGLGPRLAGIRIRGTDYCFSPVPLGGYVRLDSSHEHGDRGACMRCLAPWKKMVVYFSGPAANLVFVVVLFWIAFFVLGHRDNLPVVAEVAPGSPAAQAGLLPGDRIAAVDGGRIISWTQASVTLERAGFERPAQVDVVRPLVGVQEEGGSPQEGASLRLTFELPGHALAGAVPVAEKTHLRMGPLVAASRSLDKLVELSRLLFHSVTGLMTTRVPPSELVGPVYLFHVSAQTAAENQVSLVYLLAVISACLFFFNLLPIPVLDGGQIVLAMLEKVLQRPLAPRSIQLLIHASIVWLILLMASATVNDIARLLGA